MRRGEAGRGHGGDELAGGRAEEDPEPAGAGGRRRGAGGAAAAGGGPGAGPAGGGRGRGGARPTPPPSPASPPTKWAPAARRGRLQRPGGARCRGRTDLGERRESGWSTLGAEQACGFLQLLVGCASRPASFPGEVSALAAKGSKTWEQSRDGSS